MQTILILGGARSGKSRFAQKLAAQINGKVLFIATATCLDEEMKKRIERHRSERPEGWRTLEIPDGISKRIREIRIDEQVIIIDCIALLLNNIFHPFEEKLRARDRIRWDSVEEAANREIRGLVEWIERVDASVILVSNEIGMGVVPENALGRAFRDILGKTNQILAAHSDRVYLMVAGIPLQIKPS